MVSWIAIEYTLFLFAVVQVSMSSVEILARFLPICRGTMLPVRTSTPRDVAVALAA